MTTTYDRRSMLAATLKGGGAIILGSMAALATPSPVAGTEVRNLRWCNRCQGMWCANTGNNGHCPVHHWWDHSHYQNGSAVYWSTDGTFANGVDPYGMKWLKHCGTCKAVYFHWATTACPNNSAGHMPVGNALTVEATWTGWLSNLPKQAGWRRCTNCAALFFIGNGLGATRCARPSWPATWHQPAYRLIANNQWVEEEWLVRW
jgi:hypothetical protein